MIAGVADRKGVADKSVPGTHLLRQGGRRDKSVPGTHLLRGGRAVAGLRRAAGMVATCQERPMVHTATHTTR
jgi:hypothetical protein